MIPSLLVLAGLLSAGAQASQASQAGSPTLARQVNEQILRKHMRDEVDVFARASSSFTPQANVPASCRAQLQQAMTGMHAAMTEHLDAGVEAPDYQRSLEQGLAAAYSSEQLNAFLQRNASAGTDTVALYKEILSAPSLTALQQAQGQKLLAALEGGSPANPALADALRTASDAAAACERAKTAAP